MTHVERDGALGFTIGSNTGIDDNEVYLLGLLMKRIHSSLFHTLRLIETDRDGDDVAISEEVKDSSIRFVQNLPLGFPQPAVSGEPDGHINFEWYRSPRRVLSVSIGPENRLYWAALIGTESPRGSARYIERIPEIVLDQIARVFEGD